MKLAYFVLGALLLGSALAVEICSLQFCLPNLSQECRTQIFCFTTPCPQPPPQSCLSFVLEQLRPVQVDPPIGIPFTTLPPTLPPPTTTAPPVTNTPPPDSSEECKDPANIADGPFTNFGQPDCCVLEGLGCRQFGDSCSTTGVLFSRPVDCEPGLTCVITDPGSPGADVPNSGTCQ